MCVRSCHLHMNHCSSKSLGPVGQAIDEHCVPLCLDDEVRTKCGTHTVLQDSNLHNTGHRHTLKFTSNWLQEAHYWSKRQFLHSNKYRLSLKSCCKTNLEHTDEIQEVDSKKCNTKTLTVIMDHWLAILLKHNFAVKFASAQQIQGQTGLIPHSVWSHICPICLQHSDSDASLTLWFVLFCIHFGHLSYNNWYFFDDALLWNLPTRSNKM